MSKIQRKKAIDKVEARIKKSAFERCKALGGKVGVRVVNKDTGEKRRVCSGAKSRDLETGKMIEWGPVAETEIYIKK